MITASKGNESLRTYIVRIENIICFLNEGGELDNVAALLLELRDDLRDVLLQIRKKRYSKYHTRYWEHVYLPAIQEAQLNIYVRSGIDNGHDRWLRQLTYVKSKLEWYLNVGENPYYADIK